MPLTRCGNNGWKWGQGGHCYEGKGAKKKALKQGYAINKDKFKQEVGELDSDALEVIAEMAMVPYPTLPESANPNDPPAHANKDPLVEKLHSVSVLAIRHNSNLAFDAPKWDLVNQERLPRIAYAFRGDPNDASTWKYPHHWIRGDIDQDGYVRGVMYLHEEGLFKAWSQASTDYYGGTPFDLAILAELRKHLAEIGAGLKQISYAADLSEGQLRVLDEQFITAKLLTPENFISKPSSIIHRHLI